MSEKIALQTPVKYKGRRATVMGSCFIGGEWVYQLRFASGKIVDYVPGRMLRV